MLGDIHQKQWYQIVRNFDVYLHAKNQLDPSLLFWDIELKRILLSGSLNPAILAKYVRTRIFSDKVSSSKIPVKYQ